MANDDAITPPQVCLVCGAPVKRAASNWGYEHDDGRAVAGHIVKVANERKGRDA